MRRRGISGVALEGRSTLVRGIEQGPDWFFASGSRGFGIVPSLSDSAGSGLPIGVMGAFIAGKSRHGLAALAGGLG